MKKKTQKIWHKTKKDERKTMAHLNRLERSESCFGKSPFNINDSAVVKAHFCGTHKNSMYLSQHVAHNSQNA